MTCRINVSRASSRLPSASSVSIRSSRSGGKANASAFGAATLINHERAEVRGQRRSAERTDPAERVAKHVDRGSTGLRRRVDDGGDILVLPCHVTVRSATVGAAARRSIA